MRYYHLTGEAAQGTEDPESFGTLPEAVGLWETWEQTAKLEVPEITNED